MEVFKQGLDLKYWRDKQGREMDFVVYDENRILKALEAKRSGRSTESFKAFIDKYSEINAKIVTEVNVFEVIDELR
jgi:predicted AAA+ superfamily ATPase